MCDLIKADGRSAALHRRSIIRSVLLIMWEGRLLPVSHLYVGEDRRELTALRHASRGALTVAMVRRRCLTVPGRGVDHEDLLILRVVLPTYLRAIHSRAVRTFSVAGVRIETRLGSVKDRTHGSV